MVSCCSSGQVHLPCPSLLILLIILHSIWIIFLTNGFRLSILASLTPYVTSDFQSHSLLTVIGVVADSITAACYIPIAKLLDVWGRAEGFLLMVGFSTLGVILMASSHNLATFCAAQVIYTQSFFAFCNTLTYKRSSTLLDLLASSTPWPCLQLTRRLSRIEVLLLHSPRPHT